MTIWGVVSDVHGNLPALQEAVRLCRLGGAERFAFLGDSLGRGDPDGCVALIRSLADVSVVGNRDLDWQHRVADETRAYVLGLPASLRADDFVAVHGDPRLDPDLNSSEIRNGFRRAYRRLERERAGLFLFGHTHRARVWRLPGPDEAPELIYDAVVSSQPATIALRRPVPSVRYAINVGTTGLPFAGKGPPACAVYDSGAGRLEVIVL